MNTGAPALIRAITRGYIDAKMTSYFNWPLIAAIYPNLPYATVGLATAGSPWSGAYTIGANTWATAQVTQFTAPGLEVPGRRLRLPRRHRVQRHLRHAEVDEQQRLHHHHRDHHRQRRAERHHQPQRRTVHRRGARVVDQRQQPQHRHRTRPQPGHHPVQRLVLADVQPGYVYSITTTTGQGKGTATSPANAALALPYSDNFESTATNTEAKYLSDMQGSFEARPCTNGRSGPVHPAGHPGHPDRMAERLRRLLPDRRPDLVQLHRQGRRRPPAGRHRRTAGPRRHPVPAAGQPEPVQVPLVQHRRLVDRQELLQRQRHDPGQRHHHRAGHRHLAHPGTDLPGHRRSPPPSTATPSAR